MTGPQMLGHFSWYGHVGSTKTGGAKHFELILIVQIENYNRRKLVEMILWLAVVSTGGMTVTGN